MDAVKDSTAMTTFNKEKSLIVKIVRSRDEHAAKYNT